MPNAAQDAAFLIHRRENKFTNCATNGGVELNRMCTIDQGGCETVKALQ